MKYDLIESKNLEFKEFLENYQRIAESVVSFANAQGGEIIIGIRDIDREVIGLDEQQIFKYHDEIPQAIADQISPQLAVDCFERNIGGQVCFIIKVFPGPHKPYFLSRLGYPKGVYLRYGSHNRPADDYAIRDLERYRNNAAYEQQLNINAKFESLSTILLEKVIHGAGSEAFVLSGYGNRDVDINVKANNCGVLLFHSNPSSLIPEAYLTITKFAGANTSAIISRENFTGSIIEQFEGAYEYLKQAAGSDFYLYEKQLEPRFFEYPMDAIREILINSIVHKAYDFESPVRISMFSDRFEILNPGTFFAPINQNTLRDGLSRYRNTLIAQAFRKLNYMEKQGVGINRVFDACHKAGLPLPVFSEIEHYTKVVIYKNKSAGHFAVREISSAGYRNEFSVKDYIHHFHDVERLTSREFAQRIGKSVAMAKKILFALCQNGDIKMAGKARATYYVLNR